MQEQKYPIVEIFTSIQGEGCNLGKPANFIRFAGCNLTCSWCDTKWDKANEMLTAQEICDRLDFRVDLVVLTGGEPLLQDLTELLERFKCLKMKIAIETNGTLPTKELYFNPTYELWIACSPKPQNGYAIHEDCFYDELKYVVDGTFGIEDLQETEEPIWLQPEGSEMQKRWKEAIEIQQKAYELELDVRIGIQLHKVMEVR